MSTALSAFNATDTSWDFRPAPRVTKTGPLFLSALFHWGLFGVLCTQFLIYISAFPRDPRRNRLFVYAVFTLEIIQTIILTKSYFDTFASGFGDPEAYDRTGAIWFSVPFMSGIVAFLAEIFYAMRLYLLSESYRVPIVVCVLAVIQAGGAISCAVVVKEARLFSQIPQAAFSITSGIWTGGSALCDIVIAYYMTRYLWKRRNVGTETTQLVVKRIIRMVLETGTVTAVVAVVLLVLTMLPNHVSYYQVPAAILALLYSNSMLALLNSRINLNACRDFDREPPPHTECQLAALRFCKSPRESGITGIHSMDPSMRGAGVVKHLSFATQDSQRISGPPKSYDGHMHNIEERSIGSK
ncbi:hypothetical protein D9619_010135 [Psilocybe cf. subviscida]|uniref:DUF6534 domain-containing protein n=1 Tax=Psilocybe cf. subviscida TaxID=2480587 RepID=A0A8H5ASQ8_9AGAR|nr:hypothetical protein D9619_010135 [Psilocybe cf. subviscida]